MSLPVVYLPQARDDIDRAYVNYEGQSPGLGTRFAQAVQNQVTRIQAHPGLYGVVYQDVRASPIRTFPYVAYYREEPTQILIIAVQHGSQNWSNWQSRA